MSDIVVAKRYAKALFEAAKEQNTVAQVETELTEIVQTIQDHAELRSVLDHPNIDVPAKRQLLSNIFADRISPLVMNTIKLLIDRRRQSLLPIVLSDFVQISNESLGQADATIYTALPLSEVQVKEIADNFSRMTGKQIRVQTVVDPSLLGGITVRIGDRLYDGSLAGKLERLEKSLKQAQAM
ncbi:F0F1 ATP synthase subunit delta [Paenibacillus chitinolyticus]|uniref:F0F1 ATP synthase subunit delta n=1 Tax=Paenibacillus TaxID=44249 RepID=UPI00020D714B|nr:MULTISPECIES: F0F1 ATP synthase subunit delta [Paenibacillus]EGL13628.1 ATP synthase F1, delta subunit [Paenibacillus sp. HGF7]EPD86195.1 ATP synthase F1, delta subunit [Paenibacillus sp. HGH0039]MBV6716834.1 F0F1 ATP synthase subunit delta [Paenibacillus chitinolyticus]MEC0248414.1 F0F1 ATP synthase subunit delta [Paenibacillus chitinolyticus]GKS14221.1 ATP synthase subunit delta [Paenibacillus chitinolyticus]